MVAPPFPLLIPDLDELAEVEPVAGPLDGVRIEAELLVTGAPDRTVDWDGRGLGVETEELGRLAGLLIAGEGPGDGVDTGRDTLELPELIPGLD